MARILSDDEYICQDCGYMGRANVKLRGSGAVEKLLWCLLIIPGPFYTYWRRTGSQVECAGCRTGHIVNLDTKLGQVMLENKLRGVGPKPGGVAGAEKRKPILRKN